MEVKQKADQIIEFADDMKAESIECIDVRSKSSVTSYFVICTGTSDVHVRSIAERVNEKMRELNEKPLRSDVSDSSWVLLDYGDVIFNAMREEKRQFYDLETLWKNAQVDTNLLND